MELRVNRPGLEEYLREQIIPKYEGRDAGHDWLHIERVLDFAYLINEKLGDGGVDENLLTTAVICHDLGATGNDKEGREGHNERSAAMVRSEVGLREFFDEGEIELVATACFEHRSSYEGVRREMLSKIVADADTMDSINFERIILYYEEKYEGESEEFMIEKMWEHYLKKQHPEQGYARYDLQEAEETVGKRRGFLWQLLVEDGGRERFGAVMREKIAEMKEIGVKKPACPL